MWPELATPEASELQEKQPRDEKGTPREDQVFSIPIASQPKELSEVGLT